MLPWTSKDNEEAGDRQKVHNSSGWSQTGMIRRVAYCLHHKSDIGLVFDKIDIIIRSAAAAPDVYVTKETLPSSGGGGSCG